MLPRSLLALIALAVAVPGEAALPVGAVAPEFGADAALAGRAFRFELRDARQHGPVVVYFYPSAFTSGCNIQAHEFAVHQAEFTAAGASIIGVSLDNLDRLKDFSADPKYCGGKVPVASDAAGAIAKSYDIQVSAGDPSYKDSRGIAIGHDFAERTTFIVGRDGKVASVIGGMAPAKNVEAALAFVRGMAAPK